MGDGCCGTSADPGHFHCHGCGTCCTNLTGRWARDRGRFQALPQAGVYRLATPGGLRMFSWEQAPFTAERLAPLLAVADGQRDRLVALAYELEATRCPRYEDEVGCTIYEDRPLVCRAFPLLVLEDGGLSVAASALCPAKVPVVGAAQAANEPERVLAGLYPKETVAALAAPATVRHLAEVVSFLAGAEVLDPVTGLEEDEVHDWAKRPALDLVALAEETGVLTRQALIRQAERVRGKVRERLHGEG